MRSKLHTVLSRSVVSDSVTPLSVAHQARLSMEFSSQEYCSGLPSPTLGDLLHQEIEPSTIVSPALQGDSLPLAPPARAIFTPMSEKLSVGLCPCQRAEPGGRPSPISQQTHQPIGPLGSHGSVSNISPFTGASTAWTLLV